MGDRESEDVAASVAGPDMHRLACGGTSPRRSSPYAEAVQLSQAAFLYVQPPIPWYTYATTLGPESAPPSRREPRVIGSAEAARPLNHTMTLVSDPPVFTVKFPNYITDWSSSLSDGSFISTDPGRRSAGPRTSRSSPDRANTNSTNSALSTPLWPDTDSTPANGPDTASLATQTPLNVTSRLSPPLQSIAPRKRGRQSPDRPPSHASVTSSSSRLQAPVRRRPFRFSCTVPGCPKRFRDSTDLRRHLEKSNTHDAAVSRFQCSVCEFVTPRKDNFQRHIKTCRRTGLGDWSEANGN